MNRSVVIRCHQLGKSYRQGKEHVTVLDNLSFQIYAGESVAIIGSSGAGKSTLLNLMGGLDRCDQGCIEVLDNDLSAISDKALARLRNRHIGFVYQFHHLLGEFSAEENVAMPLLIRGVKKREALKKAQAMLTEVGLQSRYTHRPYELSGGERQRVAIARALVGEPAIVLMDEPTGNLDEHTAETIQQLLLSLNERFNTCFVIVTHDKQIARQQQRIFSLHDGHLAEVDRD